MKIVSIDDLGLISKKKIDFFYKRVEEPEHKSAFERRVWVKDQIHKCIHGDGIVCGKFYFWFHFCTLLSLKEEEDEVTGITIPAGKRKPEFRVSQVAWFEYIEWCKKKKKGIVCVKRRRAGFSWIAASDVLHDAIFRPFSRIGMNSKSEVDSRELFKKVKFLYDNLPGWLRPSTQAGKSRDYMFFGYPAKDEKGNRVTRGTQSEITCVAPTDSAWEGRMLSKWIADESGKTPNIVQMFSFTEDCLSDGGTERNGMPILFGTSGETDGAGAGLMEIWYSSDAYDLMQFFFAGYMGLIVDQYGNDLEEEAVAWIMAQRKKREKQTLKNQIDFIQKYPLTPEEAFMASSSAGLGDPLIVENAITDLLKNPRAITSGVFSKKPTGEIDFTADMKGRFFLVEYPKAHMKNAHAAGCDPVDHDDTDSSASYISAYFMAKDQGMSPRRIMGWYYGKPKKASDAYDQIIYACLFFKCQVLIERNRPRMITYFEENGYYHLLRLEPVDKSQVFNRKPRRIGVHMTDVKKEKYMAPLMSDYINTHAEYIPDIDLLKETKDWGVKNTDRLMAFGLTLIYLEDDSELPKAGDEKKKPFLATKLIKGKDGIIRRIAA